MFLDLFHLLVWYAVGNRYLASGNYLVTPSIKVCSSIAWKQINEKIIASGLKWQIVK